MSPLSLHILQDRRDGVCRIVVSLEKERVTLLEERLREPVCKRDEEGNLVKVNVRTGECLWNSYTAVYGDLTEEDYIAFPYGKDVKEGAPTVEADSENYWY